MDNRIASPQRAIALARISDARDDDTHGVDGQIEDLEEYARKIGWQLGPRRTHVLVENDTSAFKRRKIAVPGSDKPVLRTVRPKFRRALDMLASGEADGLLSVHLDRVCRDPRDLEDLIDVVESRRPRLPCESVTGSVRLADDSGVFAARILCAVGNQESRDKARRVAASHRRRAAAGKYRGGRRRFGWEPDGITPRLDEQETVRWAADSVLKGGAEGSLRHLVRRLNELEVPTVTGAEWSTGTLRDILLRPSNAAVSIYTDPETDERLEVGKGQWTPILDLEQWRAVCAVLTDPARKTTPGNRPRWLGSLIYRCGACERDGMPLTDHRGHTFVKVSGGRAGNPTYQCCAASRGTSHLRRVAGPVDDLVARVLIARLEQPDAAGLLAPAREPKADLTALRTEQAALRELLDEQARLHARRVIDARQLEAGSAELRSKLTAVEAQLARETGVTPLDGIAGRADAGRVWDGLDLGRQRELVRLLLTVTLLPQERLSGPEFDPETVRIEWRNDA